MASSPSFSDFPEDVQLNVLSFLSPAEVSAFACTSRRFAALCSASASDSPVWLAMCDRGWGSKTLIRSWASGGAASRFPYAASTAPSTAGIPSSASGSALATGPAAPLPSSSSSGGLLHYRIPRLPLGRARLLRSPQGPRRSRHIPPSGMLIRVAGRIVVGFGFRFGARDC